MIKWLWIDQMADSCDWGDPVVQPSPRKVSYEIHPVGIPHAGRIVKKWRLDRIRQDFPGSWGESSIDVVGWFASKKGAKEAAAIDLENLAPRPNQARLVP
jgi:hypothetical protein